jgi:hypothetical protein
MINIGIFDVMRLFPEFKADREEIYMKMKLSDVMLKYMEQIIEKV